MKLTDDLNLSATSRLLTSVLEKLVYFDRYNLHGGKKIM